MGALNAIGRRILILCQERGIALDELAQKMSIDPHDLISAMNESEQTISLDFIGEVCLAFGISISEFFHHSLF